MSKLGDLADIILGYPFESEKFNTNGDGICLVRGMNVTEKALRFGSDARFWNGNVDKLSGYFLQENDILIGMDGSKVGKNYAVVAKNDLPLLLVQRVACIRAKNQYLQPFLWAMISSNRFAEYVNTIKTGSSIPHISGTQIADYPIPDIPIDEAITFGKMVWDLDTKIAINNSLRFELESMAKLLYDYWFVQFDFPDENGKPYKSSGGKMVWNEALKKEIPEGWKAKQLKDISLLQQNSVFPSAGIKYNHYSIPVFDETKMPSLEDGAEIASNKYLVPNESVLVSKLNPQFKRIWLILQPQDKAICSTEFLPIKATEAGIYYLYSLLNTDAFSAHIKQKASSSTGSRKRIDPENVMTFQFAFDKAIAENFNHTVSSWIEKANRMPVENQQLVSLRDFLLPMLMNGQVKVA